MRSLGAITASIMGAVSGLFSTPTLPAPFVGRRVESVVSAFRGRRGGESRRRRAMGAAVDNARGESMILDVDEKVRRDVNEKVRRDAAYDKRRVRVVPMYTSTGIRVR